MIVKAAVKIYDRNQDKEIIIPCHRHCDAFYILKQFGYQKCDFKEIAQGFLDENNNFYYRIDARIHAIQSHQVDYYPGDAITELYSEDLW